MSPQRDAESDRAVQKVMRLDEVHGKCLKTITLRSVGVYLHSGAWYYVFKLAACGRDLGGISVYSAGFLEFTQARNRKRYR